MQRTQLFHFIFTQPGKLILVQPCTHPELFATRLVVGGSTGTIMRKWERLRDREFIHAPFACNFNHPCSAEWVLPLRYVPQLGEKLKSPLSCFSSKQAFFVSPGIWLAGHAGSESVFSLPEQEQSSTQFENFYSCKG